MYKVKLAQHNNSQMTINRQIFFTITLTLVVIAIFDVTNLDFILQDQAFLGTHGAWLVDAHDETLKYIFYKIPKWIVASYGIIMLITYLINALGIIKVTSSTLRKKMLFLILCNIALKIITLK